MVKQLIEVEVRDKKGKLCLSNPDNVSEQQMMHQMQARIDEKVGGLMCFNHVHLPVSYLQFSSTRWVVRISCCCSDQLAVVERRLKENFQ